MTACGKIQIDDFLDRDGRKVLIYSYCPPSLEVKSKIIFVMHGAERQAILYMEPWLSLADKYNFLLVCPLFSLEEFSESMYQQGNVLSDLGEINKNNDMTFSTIEDIFDYIKDSYEKPWIKDYNIYGHSAGAQFVHRMVLFMPKARFSIAISANAGWYTLPVFDTEFPYGLKNSGITEEQLEISFKNRLIILVGSEDTNPDDPFLRRNNESDEQGWNRAERGEYFYRVSQIQASLSKKNIFNWSFNIVGGVGHNNEQMTKSLELAVPEFFS
jgi:hypothetical protein